MDHFIGSWTREQADEMDRALEDVPAASASSTAAACGCVQAVQTLDISPSCHVARYHRNGTPFHFGTSTRRCPPYYHAPPARRAPDTESYLNPPQSYLNRPGQAATAPTHYVPRPTVPAPPRAPLGALSAPGRTTPVLLPYHFRRLTPAVARHREGAPETADRRGCWPAPRRRSSRVSSAAGSSAIACSKSTTGMRRSYRTQVDELTLWQRPRAASAAPTFPAERGASGTRRRRPTTSSGGGHPPASGAAFFRPAGTTGQRGQQRESNPRRSRSPARPMLAGSRTPRDGPRAPTIGSVHTRTARTRARSNGTNTTGGTP